MLNQYVVLQFYIYNARYVTMYHKYSAHFMTRSSFTTEVTDDPGQGVKCLYESLNIYCMCSYCYVLVEIGPQNCNTALSQTEALDFVLFDRKHNRTS